MSEWVQWLEVVRSRPGVRLAAGLKRAELTAVQGVLGFEWPRDLCEMLSAALPMGVDFPNWRALARAGTLKCSDASVRRIARAMEWPQEGMLFDIGHRQFWDSEWGERPEADEDAFSVARQAVAAAPPLIPIYKHRYLPARPCEAGNPVLSVHQMDIIVYGTDLATYLRNEFGGEEVPPGSTREIAREVPCWTRWMEIGR